jgi:uncharacterized protein
MAISSHAKALILIIFFSLQLLGAVVKASPASPFLFEPAQPKLEPLEQITLSVSGTEGEVSWKALKGEIRGVGEQVIYIAPRQPDFELIEVTDATGKTGTLTFEVRGFVDLQWDNVLFLLIVGLIGGLVSGFLGASGAFILTPAMMSMGVPAIVAVASNMCHRFPRVFMSALKRVESGQADIKLSLIMGLSAIIGVVCGAFLQITIQERFSDVGSNLFVSLIFIITLAIVGTLALRHAWKISQWGISEKTFEINQLTRFIRGIKIPLTMVYFSSLGTQVSWLIIIPLGFATGLLAATIAVGGFIGVPAMMYVLGASGLVASATQLVLAFLIGITGTIVYAFYGLVDIRLAMILLAGSLFGLQLGTLSTTYAKDYMIKMVMGILMILILFSLAMKVPVYLSNMAIIDRLNAETVNVLEMSNFVLLVIALVSAVSMILYALIKGYLKYQKEQKLWNEELAMSPIIEAEQFPTSISQLSPIGRFEKILVVTEGSQTSVGAVREAIRLAQRSEGRLLVMSVILTNPEHESLAKQLIEKENYDALAHLEDVKKRANEAGVFCEITVRHGIDIYHEILDEAEQNQVDLIVMGRRGLTGLKRFIIGSNTAKVIGRAQCSVLIVPTEVKITGHKIMVAVDGSRYSDIAATATISIAKCLNAQVLVVSIVHSDKRHTEVVEVIKRVEEFMSHQGINVEGQVLSGNPAEAILEMAKAKKVDLIVIGSHGRIGLDMMLMGSVSDRVISEANCATFVVKA